MEKKLHFILTLLYFLPINTCTCFCDKYILEITTGYYCDVYIHTQYSECCLNAVYLFQKHIYLPKIGRGLYNLTSYFT